jgi:hypothetical protein
MVDKQQWGHRWSAAKEDGHWEAMDYQRLYWDLPTSQKEILGTGEETVSGAATRPQQSTTQASGRTGNNILQMQMLLQIANHLNVS